jgi:hypothetical protein
VPVWVKEHRLTRLARLWVWYLFGLRQRLQRQLSGATDGKRHASAARGLRVLVPLIETSHYQHFQILLVAKALQMRGAQVRVLICGQTLDGCEIKSVRNEHSTDPCLVCRFNERHTLPLFGLEVARLSDIVSEPERESFRREGQRLAASASGRLVRHGVSLDQAVDDSVMRYYYGAVPRDRGRTDAVRAQHASSALLSMEVASRVDAAWHPDVVMTNMYCYSAWEPFFRRYRDDGRRFKSLSISPFDYNGLIVNAFEFFESTDRFRRYLESRRSPLLNDQEREALRRFLAARSTGQARVFREYEYFDTARSDATVRGQLGFDPGKRNLFLFSNVYWDVGMSECAGLYPDVLTWVLETIAIIADEPGCHLYIKPHPAEVFDSAVSLKGVAQVIREHYPLLPGNITIIEPQWKLNTYQLFSLITMGVIFNGTLGLEMMLADIPVVSAGRTAHQGLDLAIEPTSASAYRSWLVGESAPPKVDRSRLEVFAYFYFIRALIPWRLTRQAYGDRFDGFTIGGLEDLEPGRDPYLDHLCACMLDGDHTVIEAWPDPSPLPSRAAY